jgi:hypothetical protein
MNKKFKSALLAISLFVTFESGIFSGYEEELAAFMNIGDVFDVYRRPHSSTYEGKVLATTKCYQERFPESFEQQQQLLLTLSTAVANILDTAVVENPNAKLLKHEKHLFADSEILAVVTTYQNDISSLEEGLSPKEAMKSTPVMLRKLRFNRELNECTQIKKLTSEANNKILRLPGLFELDKKLKQLAKRYNNDCEYDAIADSLLSQRVLSTAIKLKDMGSHITYEEEYSALCSWLDVEIAKLEEVQELVEKLKEDSSFIISSIKEEELDLPQEYEIAKLGKEEWMIIFFQAISKHPDIVRRRTEHNREAEQLPKVIELKSKFDKNVVELKRYFGIENDDNCCNGLV